MTANTNDLTTAQRPSLLELEQAAPFSTRHIGPREQDQLAMLAELGYRTNESGELEETEPRLSLPGGCSREALVTNRGSCADHHAVASLRNS